MLVKLLKISYNERVSLNRAEENLILRVAL